MMKLKIEFAKNKCLSFNGTIRPIETIPIALINPAREHYKNIYFIELHLVNGQFSFTYFLRLVAKDV